MTWTWRDSAATVIRRVLAETRGLEVKAVRKALREAYPFGQRKYHPYKIWCDEVRVQLGLKTSKKLVDMKEAGQAELPLFEETK